MSKIYRDEGEEGSASVNPSSENLGRVSKAHQMMKPYRQCCTPSKVPFGVYAMKAHGQPAPTRQTIFSNVQLCFFLLQLNRFNSSDDFLCTANPVQSKQNRVGVSRDNYQG